MTENKNTSWRSCLDDQMKRGAGNNDRSSSSAVRKMVEMDHQNREHETINRGSFDMVQIKGIESDVLTPDTSIGRATSTSIKCPSPSLADINRDESIKHEEQYYNARSWKLYNRISNNKNKKREQKGKTLKAARRRSILNMESIPDRFRCQHQRRRSSVAAQQRRRSSTASSSFLPNMQYEGRRSSMASTTSVEKGVFHLEF
jgi:hypothetical protein